VTAPVITIDGPSRSGKGTVRRLIALELGFHLLDSGAIYRVLGLAATDARIQLDDSDALASLSDSLNLSFPYNARCTQIILNGASVGDRLRTQAAADAASRVAIHPRVRDALMNLQRRQARDPGLVGDGRDLGTIVFPDADLKIFLDANVEVRAERRYLELIQSGQKVERYAILPALEIRYMRDRTREVAALIPADDGYVIDSSDKTATQVVAKIRDLWQARGLA